MSFKKNTEAEGMKLLVVFVQAKATKSVNISDALLTTEPARFYRKTRGRTDEMPHGTQNSELPTKFASTVEKYLCISNSSVR